jgi:FkbM family methyltransferase
VWLPLGRFYRWAVRCVGWNRPSRQSIGAYGPFLLDAHFAFSDFASWGSGHNEGFSRCIEASRGRKCVVDVGAHVGLVTLPMASVIAPGGAVIAFEPAAANRALLTRHVALNRFDDRVRIDPSLVGENEIGGVTFFESSSATGKNTLVDGILGLQGHSSRLSQTTLDIYCTAHGLIPDVIKIDVEGAEVGVLEGARGLLRDHRPPVFLSVHPRLIAALGRSTDELMRFLDEVGYECRHMDGSKVEKFALREYLLTPKIA